MAIKLNKSEPTPEYDRKKYLQKFIPLVFDYAPEFDLFKLRILANDMNLGNERIIFGDLQNTISDFLISNNLANKEEGENLSLTVKGRNKKNGIENDSNLNINNNFIGSEIGQVNQSSNFSNSHQLIDINKKDINDKKTSLAIRFWKLISENKLISGILLIVIVYLIKVIFEIDLKN